MAHRVTRPLGYRLVKGGNVWWGYRCILCDHRSPVIYSSDRLAGDFAREHIIKNH